MRRRNPKATLTCHGMLALTLSVATACKSGVSSSERSNHAASAKVGALALTQPNSVDYAAKIQVVVLNGNSASCDASVATTPTASLTDKKVTSPYKVGWYRPAFFPGMPKSYNGIMGKIFGVPYPPKTLPPIVATPYVPGSKPVPPPKNPSPVPPPKNPDPAPPKNPDPAPPKNPDPAPPKNPDPAPPKNPDPVPPAPPKNPDPVPPAPPKNPDPAPPKNPDPAPPAPPKNPDPVPPVPTPDPKSPVPSEPIPTPEDTVDVPPASTTPVVEPGATPTTCVAGNFQLPYQPGQKLTLNGFPPGLYKIIAVLLNSTNSPIWQGSVSSSVAPEQTTDTGITMTPVVATPGDNVAEMPSKIVSLDTSLNTTSSSGCAALHLESQDPNGIVSPFPNAVTLAVTSTSATGMFYVDSECTTSPAATVNWPAAVSDVYLYYKDATVGSPTLSISDTNTTNGYGQLHVPFVINEAGAAATPAVAVPVTTP